MVFPDPSKTADRLAERVVSGTELNREDRNLIRSYIGAYQHLTLNPYLTQKERNKRVSQIRQALKEDDGHA